MYWDVKFVKPLSNYYIYVEIENGQKGIFDLKPYLERGVFQQLKDINYFNQVYIFFGAVTWINEQDIAPETLLAGLVDLNDMSEEKLKELGLQKRRSPNVIKAKKFLS
jgi:hypothetical protein